MSQVTIDFQYNGGTITVQGKDNESMKAFYERFANKAVINIQEKELIFSYNGKWNNNFDENQTFLQTSNSLDKSRKKMVILVAENMENEPQEELFVKSNDIICPKCGKFSLISLKNYKITLSDCQNKHNVNNILLHEFEKTQNINYSKITCGVCGQKRSNIFKYDLSFCLNCQKNICPLCRNKHNNSHSIINYDKMDYLCKEHNDFFSKYCNDCEKNICMSCEEEHEDHDTLYFGSIIPKKNDLKNSIEELKQYIDIFNEECDIIINAINKVRKNFEIYYKIKKDMIDNFKNDKKNYYILCNLNKIIKNEDIINDIIKVKNEISIENKFNYIMKIYNDMNNKDSKITKLNVDIAKENEELKRKINLLKESLEEQKVLNNESIEIRKNYELINKIIMSGIDKRTKVSKYNMQNKCLLAELVLSGYDSTKFISTEKVAYVMLEVDRFDFALKDAYLNRPSYIGCNVNISAPHMHAFALEHLAPYCTKGAKILDVGSGSGYLTVALSKMTNDTGLVVGVEHMPELYNLGIQNVKKHHSNLLTNKKIIFVNEDGRSGCKKYGPYKAIHVGAASEELPQQLIDQLDFNGRMFIPIGPKDGSQEIYLIDKDYNGKITYKSILGVCYAMLSDKETQLRGD